VQVRHAAGATFHRFNNRRSQSRKRQSLKEGFLMKSKKTLVIAASIFVLTLAAFPHHASAAVNAYLYIDARSAPSVFGISQVISILASVILP
jgi:hypothetical protein